LYKAAEIELFLSFIGKLSCSNVNFSVEYSAVYLSLRQNGLNLKITTKVWRKNLPPLRPSMTDKKGRFASFAALGKGCAPPARGV